VTPCWDHGKNDLEKKNPPERPSWADTEKPVENYVCPKDRPDYGQIKGGGEEKKEMEKRLRLYD
jgi:hypothetical protein